MTKYSWEQSHNGALWQPIFGASSSTLEWYVPWKITWYRRVATNGTKRAYSNVVKVTRR